MGKAVFEVGDYPKPKRENVVDHDAATLSKMLDMADADIAKLILYMAETDDKRDETLKRLTAELEEKRREYPAFAETPEEGWTVEEGETVPHFGDGNSYVSPKMLKTVMDWDIDTKHKEKG